MKISNGASKNRIIFFSAVLMAGLGVFAMAGSASANTGTFLSETKDSGQNNASWGNIVWITTQPSANTSVTLKVRTCSNNLCNGAGDPADFSGCTNPITINSANASNSPTGVALSSSCVIAGKRWVQYQAVLSSTDDNVPSISVITINYNYYYVGTWNLISSPYNTTDPANALAKVEWGESTPTGTDVKFQVRTATNNNNGTPGDPADDSPNAWFPADGTSFCGPDNGTAGTCNTGTYFTDPAGGETVDNDLKGGTSDQWFQYKAWLVSDGSATPTADNIQTSYVVNAPPVVSAVTASENTNGTISIGYTLADSDSASLTVSAYADIGVALNEAGGTLLSTDTTAVTVSDATLLPSAGTIQIDSEQIAYTSKNGNNLEGTVTRGVNNTTAVAHTNTAVIWAKALTTAPGDNIGAGQTVGSGKTITWTMKSDFDGVYRNVSQGKIRVTANDGNIANQVGNGDSSAFVIDTKNPTPGTNQVLVDATDAVAGDSGHKATITLSCTDNSALQMKVGLESNLSDASWEAYNATKLLALLTDPETIYAQFKDVYNNTTAISNITTPETPTAVMVQDTSNMKMTPSEYRLFTAWKTVAAPAPGFANYKVYRSDNGTDYSLLNTQTDRAINYYGDSTTLYDTRYWYKLKTTDSIGNVSFFSQSMRGKANGTQDEDEGGGGTAPGDFPVISEVVPGTPTSTSVNITWETDDPSDSVVQYMTQTGGDFEANNALSKGTATFADSDGNLGDHSVTLTNLTPNTPYYFRVISTSAVGSAKTEKLNINGYTFTTADGPLITNLNVDSETNDSATLSWDNTVSGASTFIYYSTSSDLSDATKIGSAELTTTHAVTIDGLNADTDYYYRAESMDTNGATTYSPQNPPYAYFTTNDSTAPQYVSGSEPANLLTSWSHTAIYWQTDEQALGQIRYKKGSDPYSSWYPATPTDYNTSHYITLTSLDSNTTYAYQVKSTDIATNVFTDATEYTFHTQADPAFQHEPLDDITGISEEIITDTEAAISFNTVDAANDPVAANCTVDYGTAPGVYTVSVSETADTYSEIHSINLTGLDPDTDPYYYRITCEDNLSNSAQSIEGTFQTLQIQIDHVPLAEASPDANPTVTEYSDTEAVITYDADTETTSKLCYSISSGIDVDTCPNSFAITDPTVLHSFHLTDTQLDPDTQYYLKMKITDSDDGSDTFTTGEIDFTTLPIQVDHIPLIDAAHDADPAITQYSNTEAVVTFNAGTATTSKLCYATSSGINIDTCSGETPVTNSKIHAYHLTPLTPETPYYVKMKLTDSDNAGDTYTTGEVNFTTLQNPEFQHDDLSTIEEIISDPGSAGAVITFETRDAEGDRIPAECIIEYRATGQAYDPLVSVAEDGFNETHRMQITGLNPGENYFYTIECADNNDNTAESEEQTFLTTEEVVGDATAPEISGVKTSNVTGESVTVGWKTDEDSNGTVSYGITSGTYENGAVNYLVNSDITEYVTSHEVIINNLTPGTKYYYVVISVDAAGNISESSESSFTTSANSSLSGIDFSSIKLGEVVVTWTTGEKTTSIVEYGLTEFYGESKESSTSTSDHSITISGLTSNTKYHFRISGKDALNNLYSSGDYTFTPKSPPTISDTKVNEVTEHEVKLSFTTSTATDALVTYTSTQDPEDTGSQGIPILTTAHELTLKNLTPGTTYSYTVKVTDIDGNSTTYPDPSTSSGQAQPAFTTGIDNTPPKIDQVRTDSALAQNDKVQTIISWLTDEPATTELIYKEGANAEKKEVKINTNPALNHIAVITSFKPGTVYYFQAKSTDNSNNTATSSDFALLTPKRKENIIQIIISNFQDIFGWAKF